MVRFNGRKDDLLDVLDKSLDAVTTIANDLSGKIDVLKTGVENEITDLRSQISSLKKQVNEQHYRISQIARILALQISRNYNVSNKISRIKEIKRLLDSNVLPAPTKNDLRVQLEKEEMALWKTVAHALVDLIMNELKEIEDI